MLDAKSFWKESTIVSMVWRWRSGGNNVLQQPPPQRQQNHSSVLQRKQNWCGVAR